MVISTNSCKPARRRGTATVEFAVIAPVFFLLVLGIIEIGRMTMVQEILINAAREGARMAIVPGKTDAQVTTTIDNYLAASSISGHSRSVSPSLATSPASGTAITVSVSVPCTSVSWLGNTTWFGGNNLSAFVVMIKE